MVAGTWYAFLEPSSGTPNHILDWEVHRISMQKILEESKRASIYQLWADPRFSKQLCNPLCPLMCADPKLEIRIEWMLDYIT